MSQPPLFPLSPSNIAWPVTRTPTFSTRIATHVSGREVRVPLFSYPLYSYELTVEGLDQYSAFNGLGAETYQQLRGLYESVQGQYGTFLYQDPGDGSVTGQLEGTGDGQTTGFTLYRTIGGAVRAVDWVLGISQVYLNGGAVDADQYTLVQPNVLSFNTAPNGGVQISVDMTYAWLCRFTSDAQDFEEFMSGLHQVSSLKFKGVKP